MGWMALSLTAAEGEWLTDLAQAKAQAKAGGKLVLLEFTGSDWCPPCKNLHQTVIMSKEFTEFAKQNLVLVEVDFPRTKQQSAALKKQNQELQATFAITGYPTIVVLDANGKELAKEIGYGGASAADYVAKLKQQLKK